MVSLSILIIKLQRSKSLSTYSQPYIKIKAPNNSLLEAFDIVLYMIRNSIISIDYHPYLL